MFLRSRDSFHPISLRRPERAFSLASLIALSLACLCNGQTVTLTFEGLQDNEPISNYYDGGLGGTGSGPGTNYGIYFGSDALALVAKSAGGSGNFSGNPSGATIATFVSGPGVVMNVPGGFTTGFSFYYSSGSNSGSVIVYDGLNGTGNVLATVNLAPTGSPCNGSTYYYSCWNTQGVSFSGVAQSVDFSGAINKIGFDNITPGSSTPGTGTTPNGPVLTVTPTVTSTTSTLTPGNVAQTVTVTNLGAPGSFTAAIQTSSCPTGVYCPGIGFSIQPTGASIGGAGSTTDLTVSFNTTDLPPGIYTGTYTVTPVNSIISVTGLGRPTTRISRTANPASLQGSPSGTYMVTVQGHLLPTVAPSPGLIFNLTAAQPEYSQTFMVSEEAGYSIPVAANYSGQGGPAVTGTLTGAMCPFDVTVTCTTESITLQAAVGTLPDGDSAIGALTLTCQTSIPCDNSPLIISVLINAPTPSTVTKVLPQFGVGLGFVTDFYVVNSGTSAANFSINFHDDNGNPVALPFGSAGNLPTLSGSIPAGGAAYYEAGTPDTNPYLFGSAIVTADPTITVQAVFRRLAGGSYYEAGVPAASGSNEIEVPFDATIFSGNNSQLYTGLAIANLDPSNSANVSCTARDSGGNVIPDAIAIPALNPFGHWAGYQFPALIGKRGTFDCKSNTQIGAIGTRNLGTNAISSLPVIAP